MQERSSGRRCFSRAQAQNSVLRPAVMTLAKPKPLGKMANQVWNQPLDSVRKMKDVSATTGRPEVTTMSQ